MGYAVMAGAASRLLLGYDSFGNVCGRKNSPVAGAPLSGRDMTLKKHVFFMNSCNVAVQDRRLGTTALCVSSCPEEQLDTLEEIQLFANTSGSFLCVYSLNFFNYTQSPSAGTLCPRLPVPPSKSFPLFNRCIPQTPECYSLFASVLINDVDALHRILRGIMSGRDIILGLCLLALAWALAMLFTFRFVTTLLVHIFISLVILGLLCTAEVIEGGQVEYQPLLGIRYMWWYHLIGLFWTSEFILACQQMTIAGTVATCYFNRNKNNPPDRPILSSLSILFCYHQGTVAKGSFLITVTRIPRMVLMYMYNTLKEKRSAWSRDAYGGCCSCGCWGLTQYLLRFNQHAYTAAAINGTDFCTSAKDALKILSKNSSHFMSVICFGDFIIFLGKVLVVCYTVFGGLMAFNYNRVLQVWTIPLLLVAFFAYLVAHSFLSVFGTVLETLLLCFAVDLETNDGSAEKPYFMDQEFLNFVKRIQKFNNSRSERDKDSLRNQEGTELQPIGT
ncbi:choline transporter-like protein 3 isoform X2 [Perognathus longimembris pacificus]|uniref:choline transporter-like protein 3 isoform X2 n=1 Tax=Perognathus longimembris pacificus TaxID=214514 RepID=UPI0020189E05|nr:choline transporter-like protein 3 isoform X2 [Perognathus longimembris pacificus]